MMKKLTVEAYLERNLKMKVPEGTCCYEPRCRDCAYMEMDNDHYNDGTRRCAYKGEWLSPSSYVCANFTY